MSTALGLVRGKGPRSVATVAAVSQKVGAGIALSAPRGAPSHTNHRKARWGTRSPRCGRVAARVVGRVAPRVTAGAADGLRLALRGACSWRGGHAAWGLFSGESGKARPWSRRRSGPAQQQRESTLGLQWRWSGSSSVASVCGGLSHERGLPPRQDPDRERQAQFGPWRQRRRALQARAALNWRRLSGTACGSSEVHGRPWLLSPASRSCGGLCCTSR